MSVNDWKLQMTFVYKIVILSGLTDCSFNHILASKSKLQVRNEVNHSATPSCIKLGHSSSSWEFYPNTVLLVNHVWRNYHNLNFIHLRVSLRTTSQLTTTELTTMEGKITPKQIKLESVTLENNIVLEP